MNTLQQTIYGVLQSSQKTEEPNMIYVQLPNLYPRKGEATIGHDQLIVSNIESRHPRVVVVVIRGGGRGYGEHSLLVQFFLHFLPPFPNPLGDLPPPLWIKYFAAPTGRVLTTFILTK